MQLIADADLDSLVTSEETRPPAWLRWMGLALGPIAALAIWLLLGATASSVSPPPASATGDLSREGAIVLALMGWMALWWLTQAVELSTTALLPLVVLPVTGVTTTFAETAAPYADEIIFLFAGGCLLAMALERHGLSERFARALLRAAGPRPIVIVGAFLVGSSIASAFVSNTATTAMMLPLAIAAGARVVRAAPDDRAMRRANAAFQVAVLLAVAYGASIGGTLTIIGSPPNPIAAKALANAGVPMSFGRWLAFSGPTCLVFLPLVWALLACVLLPVRHAKILAQTREEPLPALTRASWLTLAVFGLTVVLWVLMPILPPGLARLKDGGIAVIAGTLLLLVPLGRSPERTALSWRDATRLPWGVFILFGGGLSVAAAMQRHGVAHWLSRGFHDLSAAPEIVIVGGVVVVMIFMTELASNTALTATVVPVLLALAPAIGIPPEKLVIPAAFAASWAFMLPVGTPPNALIFSTGRVPAMTMARVGFVLNLVAALVITLMAWLLL